MSWQYPKISELQKTTISVTNNSSSPKTFNLQGNMTGLPFVEGGNNSYLPAVNIPTGTSNSFGTIVNGKLYVPCSGSNFIAVIDTATNLVLYNITASLSPLVAVSYGNYVYVGANGVVFIIDSLTDTIISTISVSGRTVPVVCGDKLLCTIYQSLGFLDLTVIDLSTNTISATISSSHLTSVGDFDSVTNVYYSYNASASGDEGYSIIDLNTNTLSYIITPYATGSGGSIAVDVDMRVYVVSQGIGGNGIFVYDINTDLLVGSISQSFGLSYRLIYANGFVYSIAGAYLLKLDLLNFDVLDSLLMGGTMSVIPNYNYKTNSILIPNNANIVNIVELDTFTLENSFPVSVNPQTVVLFNDSINSFYSVNSNGASSDVSFVGYQEQVVFTTDSGEPIEAWSQQISYQPMCIDRMIVDNGNDKNSLSYGLTYGTSNPSGDDTTSSFSLLKYISAEQLANLAEFSGKDLPQCILDGFHYLQGTVAGGETLTFTFWFRDLNASDTLKNDYHPAMSKYATMMYGKAIAEKLKTSPSELYEKRKEQLILSKVSERDDIILVIRRKAK